MENTETTKKTSRPVSLFLLIPALLFGIISLALAVVGLGLIPIVPALIGIILCGVSMLLFKKSYKVFTIIVLSISILSAVVSVYRGAVGPKVAVDNTLDSTMVKTQEGIGNDLNDAFGDDTEAKDSTKAAEVPVK